MKRFIANWLLSCADLIDTIVEVLTLGLVLQTEAAHCVYFAAGTQMVEAEWLGYEDLLI